MLSACRSNAEIYPPGGTNNLPIVGKPKREILSPAPIEKEGRRRGSHEASYREALMNHPGRANLEENMPTRNRRRGEEKPRRMNSQPNQRAAASNYLIDVRGPVTIVRGG